MPAKVMLLAVGLGVGGTETHIFELATRIDRSRFDVTVCTLKPNGRIADELSARGVRVVSLDGAGKWDIRVLYRLWKLLLTEKPDVLQAFLFWSNFAARAVGWVCGAFPVISSYHDEVVSESWAIRLIDRLTLKWTDKIVCCSKAVSRSLVTQIGGTADTHTIIPFGVDAGQFVSALPASRQELGLRSNGMVVATVCRLVEPKKGLRILLEAMGRLKQEEGVPPFQLLIVGDGPSRSMLESMQEQLGLSHQVVFAGVRRDLPRILAMVDVFVLPSLYEGFGIALLEAMAAGKPVIATTVGGIPEFVRSGELGLLVPPRDSVRLAAAIHQLLSDPTLAKTMGVNGQAYVCQKYTIQSVVNQHEQLYERCLLRRPGVSFPSPARV